MERVEKLNQLYELTWKGLAVVIVGIGLGTVVVATFDQPPAPKKYFLVFAG